MFLKSKPPHIGPQLPAEILNNPSEHRQELEVFSSELKSWWWRYYKRLEPVQHRNGQPVYEFHTPEGQVTLPQNFVNWLTESAGQGDRRVWKRVDDAIFSGDLFQTNRKGWQAYS